MTRVLQRTPVPAVQGRQVISAYIFFGEEESHGVVLNLDDGLVLSLEFCNEPSIQIEVIELRVEEGDAVLLQTIS